MHFLELAAEHGRAARVDDDEVHVLGAVKFALALDPGQNVDVVRDRLPGRRAWEQPHQRRDILQCRHDLLDARDRDMHARQRGTHSTVDFVCYDRQRACFRNGEIRPGDAHVGVDKLLPEVNTRCVDEFCWLVAGFDL